MKMVAARMSLFLSFLVLAESAKVLVLSPALVKSGFFILDAIAGELATRGHEVRFSC